MKVSVLINNYNNGRYIQESIDSVLSQDFDGQLEVVVYDDGSTDDSLLKLKAYGKRIGLLANPNHGSCPAFNQANAIAEAFRQATGELIFLLDGDDAFLPGKIRAYVDVFQASPDVELVQSATRVVDETGHLIRINNDIPENDNVLALYYNFHRTNFFYQTSALAWRREAIRRFLPLEYDGHCNIWPDVRLSRRVPFSGRVVTKSIPYTLYRVHQKNHYGVKGRTAFELIRRNVAIHSQIDSFASAHGMPRVNYWRSRELWGLMKQAAVDCLLMRR